MVSYQQFVEELQSSDLLSLNELQAYTARVSSNGDLSAEHLAQLLVGEQVLTRWQTQQIAGGNGRRLRLGNYEILDQLGQGGMGMVFKARHRRMNRVVALKIVAPHVAKRPESLGRFQQEVEATAKLEHENIVIAHDADESGGTHFLVMQYVVGRDLASLVKKVGPFTQQQAVSCVWQTAIGLQYAHEEGIIHRDIKPSNLLLEKSGRIKILDMGLARLQINDQGEGLTSTGQIMGTVDYMAPEQARQTRTADARADIYSLGMTLFYLLTGNVAFPGESPVQKLLDHQNQAPPLLQTAAPDVSPELEPIFRKMVEKNPDHRYQSMAEVLNVLKPFSTEVVGGLDDWEATTVHDSEVILQDIDPISLSNWTAPESDATPIERTTVGSQPIWSQSQTDETAATLPAASRPSKSWLRNPLVWIAVALAGLLLAGGTAAAIFSNLNPRPIHETAEGSGSGQSPIRKRDPADAEEPKEQKPLIGLAKYRSWSRGELEPLRARFVEIVDNQIVLQVADEEFVTAPFVNLQPADREYVRQRLAAQTSPRNPQADGLVHYWPMDVIENYTANDNIGDNNFKFVGYDQRSPSGKGKVGGAARFYGDKTLAQTTGPIIFPQYTIAFWLKVDALTGVNPRVIAPISGYGDWIVINHEANQGVGLYSNQGEHNAHMKTPMPTHTWEYYTITVDLESGNIVIYRNAVFAAQGPLIDLQPIGPWMLGHNTSGDNHGDTLTGLIDELRIYNRILPASDIRKLFAGEPLGPESSTTSD